MTWILLLPVAGLLFLSLALVDWTLYRLEQNESYHSRWKGFGVAGLSLLLLWGGLGAWAARPSWASTVDLAQAPPATATRTFAWQSALQPPLALAGALLERQDPPTLPQARADRATLHEARRLLANQPQGSEVEEVLLERADTLLGAAYKALGAQWALVRGGDWSAQTRLRSLEVLRHATEQYEQLAQCLTAGRSDCLPTSARSERSSTLHAWQRAIRLYLLDCLRFDEEDPDLAWLPAAELRAARERLDAGRAYLTAHPLPDWGQPVTAAADHLFQEADQALWREEIAVANGSWTRGSMARAYKPVQMAWDQLFAEALCAMETEGACAKGQH
jgi:hypothetical protein